jgi:predicted house-cleaning noncanonical NTP pyrophosphatase (MazG superfamily)
MKQPKLVRDYIPQIIEEDSERTCDYHIADTEEYRQRLFDKMREELDEFIEDPSYEEAADMYEVFRAICLEFALSIDSVHNVAAEKRSQRGAFFDKIVLERVD